MWKKNYERNGWLIGDKKTSLNMFRLLSNPFLKELTILDLREFISEK